MRLHGQAANPPRGGNRDREEELGWRWLQRRPLIRYQQHNSACTPLQKTGLLCGNKAKQLLRAFVWTGSFILTHEWKLTWEWRTVAFKCSHVEMKARPISLCWAVYFGIDWKMRASKGEERSTLCGAFREFLWGPTVAAAAAVTGRYLQANCSHWSQENGLADWLL